MTVYARRLLVLSCWLGLLMQAPALLAETPVATPQSPAINAASTDATQAAKAELRKPPRRIAVLPAQGDATPEHKEDVRMAVHNNLSSKAFELLKPYEVDEALLSLRQTDGLVLETASPETLARKLEVDGLLFLEVPAVSKFYVGAYAQQTVESRLKLYALDRNAVLWEKTSAETEREGGVSLNVLSMLATAVTSSFVLTDGVRRTLIDRLARSVTSDIPAPEGARGSVQPPRIDTAISNAFEGPFRSGDEIKIAMKAEPGLIATFNVGSRIVRQKMEEKSPGEYLGRYVVQDGDHAERLLMAVQVLRPKDRMTLEWRVAGSIAIDTHAPEAVTALHGRSVREGLRIGWTAPPTAEKLRFQIERADSGGVFKPVGESEVGEWLDAAVEPGKSYFYRVTAVDAAKNRSPAVQQRLTHVAPGPTRVSADLGEATTWYALASPYLIEGAIRVLPAATLQLEPGVVIEFAPKASLEVLGRIDAAGTAEGVIQVQGPDWKLLVKSAGTQGNRFSQVRFGGEGGAVVVDGGKLAMSDVAMTGQATPLTIVGASEVDLQQVSIQRAKIGLQLDNGRVRAQDLKVSLSDVGLLFDRQGLLSSRNLVLDRNVQHAVAAGAGISLDDVRFSETAYEALMPKLKNVRVNWASVPDENNLRHRWQDARIKSVAQAMSRKAWSAGAATLAEIDDGSDPRLSALAQALGVLTGKPAPVGAALAEAVERLEKQKPASALILLQEASTPYRAQLADSYLIAQAKPRFAPLFLDAFYPQRLQQGGVWAGKLVGRIKASQVLAVQRSGALQRFWVAHVVDGVAAEQDLLLAGAIARENKELRIGVLNANEHAEVLQKLTATLDTHKFHYVMLGQGIYGAPVRQKARELGLNLIIEVSQNVRLEDSQLSATLKQIEARLQLALHDVEADRPLNRFSTQGSSVDFRSASGLARVIGEAFAKVEPDTVRALWSAAGLFAQRASLPAPAVATPPVIETAKPAPAAQEVLPPVGSGLSDVKELPAPTIAPPVIVGEPMAVNAAEAPAKP